MKLDKFSDYALRVLVALAVYGPDRLSSAQIAQQYRLSEHHIAKVASALVKGGFVASERGRAGGLTLARSANDITIGAVLRVIKADEPVVECFGTDKSCCILPACGLRTPLKDAQEAFFAVLDGYTLDDVTQSRNMLRDLLGAKS